MFHFLPILPFLIFHSNSLPAVTAITTSTSENEQLQSCKSMKDIEKNSYDWQNFFSPSSWHSNDWNIKRPEFLSTWRPADWNFHTPMNIKETGKNYEISIDLPGMIKENISISVKDNSMVISGDRSSVDESQEGEKYHRVEIPYGHTSRSFYLPSNAMKNQVKATYVNGVLHLTIPKSDPALQNDIKVDIL
jgi:HSP20 family protein